MSLPRYENAVSYSQDQGQGYRLYVQYKKSSVCTFDKMSFRIQSDLGFIIVTRSYPLNCFIIPSNQSIKSVLGSTKETFTVVIEGDNKKNLQQLAQIYTNRKYATSPHSESFKQIYQNESVSQFIRSSKRSFELLVSNTDFFEIGHNHYLKFIQSRGIPGEYTLLTRIKKSLVRDYRLGAYPEEVSFDFAGVPIVSTIHRSSDLVAAAGVPGNSEPTIEFQFRSNDLSSLKKLKQVFLNQLCYHNSYHFFETSIENIDVSFIPDKVVFNLASWKLKEARPICFMKSKSPPK